jgi:hypothetical protein
MWTLNPVLRGIQQMAGKPGRSGGARKNAGGRRAGAGRPAGARNKPRLIDGLPITDCPAKWLLALVNHTAVPLRVRVNAAKALMPFMHPPG